MNKKELALILQEGEGLTIEFKRTAQETAQEKGKTTQETTQEKSY
jgi:hypothetical protein